jgi:putative redox protein
MLKEVSVKWDETTPMRFTSTSASGFSVVMDTPGEQNTGVPSFTPKLLLLVSLGGCTAMDVISILKKMRQDVTGYHLEVKGWERSEHPTKFERIVVEHVVEGNNINPEMVERALSLSHEKYCSVSACLVGSVEIEFTYRIVEPANAQ